MSLLIIYYYNHDVCELNEELAPKQVRVNSVNPASVKTNIFLAAGIVNSIEDNDKVFTFSCIVFF